MLKILTHEHVEVSLHEGYENGTGQLTDDGDETQHRVVEAPAFAEHADREQRPWKKTDTGTLV